MIEATKRRRRRAYDPERERDIEGGARPAPTLRTLWPHDRTEALVSQRAINQRRVSRERKDRLALIREQVRSGELTIRKATAAERAAWAREHQERRER